MEKAREVRQACVWNSNASVETVARAILAERDRCARIAEEYRRAYGLDEKYRHGMDDTARDIATAIRGGSNDRG